MANLMLTKQCNLHCSYCFANEFVNQQSDVMSYENFLKCLRFLLSNPSTRIGLIGGEPTLHPELKQMLATLIDSPFKSVCLFTNGILLDRYFAELRNSKFQILINLNSPESVGQNLYDRTMDNLDQMINHLYMREQIELSLNIHSPGMDFEYMLDALKRFRQNRVRLSIAVPNIDEDRNLEPFAYFRSMEETVRTLIKALLEMDIAPCFDCNLPPLCLATKDDYALFCQHEKTMQRSNLNKGNPTCKPVIDILPDLRVVRCFGVSGYNKVNLLDFRNEEELKQYFSAEIDALAYHILPSENCRGCYEYAVGKCSCGCYAYRLNRMYQLKDYAEQEFGVLR